MRKKILIALTASLFYTSEIMKGSDNVQHGFITTLTKNLTGNNDKAYNQNCFESKMHNKLYNASAFVEDQISEVVLVKNSLNNIHLSTDDSQVLKNFLNTLHVTLNHVKKDIEDVTKILDKK